MDQQSLQLREKWLRLTVRMSRRSSDPPLKLEKLENLNAFFVNQANFSWQGGLIGWYGWQYSYKYVDCVSESGNVAIDTITYIMILRFSAPVAGQWSAAQVCNKTGEMLQGQGCEEVRAVGFGNASLEMVPRREDVPSSNLRVFGMLPPELSCFYTEWW
ncbi:hypothetical protein TCE0_033f08170 [Talaromyces pinophilus]|uniref:Uncharacterized protein n=1 Tax=Talaromyces pinophilus TaxID=128442 RepID=A0A6V8HAD7_TALPI|nr:hypothetical protein TCE0_033f08170 [Talaromyces pinophilus]